MTLLFPEHGKNTSRFLFLFAFFGVSVPRHQRAEEPPFPRAAISHGRSMITRGEIHHARGTDCNFLADRTLGRPGCNAASAYLCWSVVGGWWITLPRILRVIRHSGGSVCSLVVDVYVKLTCVFLSSTLSLIVPTQYELLICCFIYCVLLSMCIFYIQDSCWKRALSSTLAHLHYFSLDQLAQIDSIRIRFFN